MLNMIKTAMLVSTLAIVAGCAAGAEADLAPGADVDALEGQQLITSVNAQGTWTAYAHAPVQGYQEAAITASADFTGPSGYTRRMGVCALRMTTTACSTVSNCSGIAVPSGGFRYCTAPDGAGQKYCAIRDGSPSATCAGTPALGGATVAPGTYTTPSVPATNNTNYISYGCFEGCAATDPSSSSAATVTVINSCTGWCFCKKFPDHPNCVF